MRISFTRDREKERVKEQQKQREQKTWEYFKTTSIVEAAHKAKEMGWKEDKVQLRIVNKGTVDEQYFVEPYEKGCSCRGILKYRDFFD